MKFKRKLKRSSLFLFFLLVVNLGYICSKDVDHPPRSNQEVNQQKKQISGVVRDINNETIPGVAIKEVDTSNGVITDSDGKFSITVLPNSQLEFSFLGYRTQIIKVDPYKTHLNIILEEELSQLDELVVIGYGTQKKRDITGAISSLNLKDIYNTPTNDVLGALQGRVSGVQVVSSSGAPGDGYNITVRGQSSLNSGNAPLYVIDGVPVESNSLSRLNGSESHGLNPLSFINPNDIESIEVLKDASSTSIYGSRAANGVILITTKQGKTGKATVSVNTYFGASRISRHLDVLNASEWRSVVLDAYKNLDVYNNANSPSEPHWSVIDSLNPMNNGDVDWQKEMYRVAWQENLELSVNGGNNLGNYSLSTSILNQDGIFLGSNYKRINSRLKVDFNIAPKLKVGYNVLFSHELNDRISAGGEGNTSLVQSILTRPPTYSLTYPDGSPINYFLGKRNPVGMALETIHDNKVYRIVGGQYLEYEIIKDLKLRSSINIDFASMKEDEFLPTTVDYREGYNTGAVRSSTNFTWINENYITYNKTINSIHQISLLSGFSQQAWKYEITGLNGMYFASDYVYTLNGAGTISNQEVNRIEEHGLVSYFGRISYGYKDKYLLQANVRADGSSRFGANKRFGYFPSTSAAWRFTEEFNDLKKILSDGKLRFSIGRTGNEAIGNYISQGEFSVENNYLGNSGAAPTVMPNADLTWEASTQYDLGLDLSFLNSRIEFNADAYIKDTKGLLFAVPIPETTGFSSITQNIGEIRNKGLEFSLFTRNLVGKFNWNTNFNISFNRNKIMALPDEVLTNGYIQNGAYHILKVGQPIGIFYGYKFKGVYSTDEDNVKEVRNASSNGKIFRGGDPIWDDLNGDNIINADDRQIIGDAQPKFVGGFTNDFSYAGFSLNVFFQFSYGNDIYSNLNRLRNSVRSYDNVSREALNRWKEQGDITNYPRPIRNDPLETDSRVSDRWIEDGSYLRLKNVTLSYDFPKTLTKKLSISRLGAYASIDNLITWTKYTGYDPDVNSMGGLRLGIDDGSYPQNKTIILGLNITF